MINLPLELDIATAPDRRRQVLESLARGPRELILDMREWANSPAEP